ncbi:DNA helicase RecG [Candidatus Uhrbacteria bacterium CG10_big_fil_rev_8_21_14_0_10_48_11]|uniref:DNA helicase RecG n=1 Tax=Candidatus Uhrbacteria bacterium CG10_big_fil_rev_8_21_14_0_10_48_11 TaxID=1975037 RepID=A0A2M8LFX5_9BACT|nr:MAG: DNA helicase RecG [Candidatus Uhrbacteria bacterium CG10_big_fil_rev_8_21_14_0_10_48_11]
MHLSTNGKKTVELERSVTELPGIGPAAARLLAKLGIRRIQDLLYHLPTDYEDYTKTVTVRAAPLGSPVSLEGKVTNLTTRKSRTNRGLVVNEGLFQDATGALSVVWFSYYPAARLPKTETVIIAGTVTLARGKRQLVNPLWEVAAKRPFFTKYLLPIYPLTKGLHEWQLRRWIAGVVPLSEEVSDDVPSDLLVKYALPSCGAALQSIHRPRSRAEAERARVRLLFDDLLVCLLAGFVRASERREYRAPKILVDDKEIKTLEQLLPFSLTNEQQLAVAAIRSDVAKQYPMQRLLAGEVGSGKTAVAAIAALMVVSSGGQVLYLAPTEILARQQYEVLSGWFQKKKIIVALLTAKQSFINGEIVSKKQVEELLGSGMVQVIVGTQSLFNAKVKFSKLSLVVVDEQHRFGVLQRFSAQQKGKAMIPHLLSMTATPIPRTLQLVAYGDLAISTLQEMPRGNRKVHTIVVRPKERSEVERRLRKRVLAGEQAYVVCPLIDPSSKLEARAAKAEYKRLATEVFPDVTVGYLDGKMKAEEKVKALEDFRKGAVRILVTTSIVEVGVDVKQASIMLIEGADRFGLAQLHQLRGRIGRSGAEAYCLLFTEKMDERVLGRLRYFAKTASAFALAEYDLAERGPGEWLGTAQSGHGISAVVLADQSLREKAEEAANYLFKKDKKLARYPILRARVRDLVSVIALPS